MAEKTVDEQQTPDRLPSVDSGGDKPPGKSTGLKIFIVIAVVVVVALGVVYKAGLIPPRGLPVDEPPASAKPEPAFSGGRPENLFSSDNLLASVGSKPADQPGLKLPDSDKLGSPDSDSKVQTPPPSGQAGATGEPPPQPEPPAAVGPGPMPPAMSGHFAPRTVETPVIVSREPTAAGPEQEKAKPPQEPSQESAAPNEARKGPRKGTSEERGETKSPGRDKGKKAAQPPASKPLESSVASAQKTPEIADRARPEQFQLPGSMMVKIHSYTGTTVKWGVMVILDDSETMARHVKPWDSGRTEAATNLVGKLSEIMTPGSKIAVRDFGCGKPSRDDKKKGPCTSNTLYDWNAAPFKNLKEKVGNTNPGGQTNPCAAAALAAKQDFKGAAAGLTPRILIVTNGAAKCEFKDALKSVGHTEAKEKPVIDVIGIGLNKKRERGYSTLAKKSGGVFLKADSPADIDQILARYDKILKTKTMEKVEVRGEKAVFHVSPEEELTLAPGTYTVILPLVAGIQASKRTIPNVKVSSGEANVMEVRVKKGKLAVQAGKK